MPKVVAYENVLTRMQSIGFRCLYHNSGAFGPSANPLSPVGWIGDADPSIRAEALPFTIAFAEPRPENLARGVDEFWINNTRSHAWLMPKSHWSYELRFGNGDWLPDALSRLGVDPDPLRVQSNGAAIEFSRTEALSVREFIERMLRRLRGSDFSLAFPGEPVIGTVHHHGQIWWETSNQNLFNGLQAIGRRLANP